MKIKFYSLAGFLLLLGTASFGQATIELPTTSGSFNPGSGPVTAAQGPISLAKDNSNNNTFSPLNGANATTVTMSLTNQQYGIAGSGAPIIITGYSNISGGLAFGAAPTTAFGGATQQVDPGNIFDNLGAFSVAPGGPTDNMFTAASSLAAGTGIVSGAQFPPAGEANGSVYIFTNAQLQHDLAGGPTVNNTATRYYYGNLVITFNRFVQNPIIHIAGLGGSYRYFPVTGTNSLDPTQWLSTYFSTELDVQGATVTRLSGNSFFNASGFTITNGAASPSGASVATTGFFNEIGAASGSVRVNATVKTLTLKVYLRGSDNSNFPWSAIGAPGAGQQVSGGQRNPLTGDIWSVSVSAEPAQLIPLPVTGMNLSGHLNGNDVVLNWKTLTESNTDHFEIERCTDGISFAPIANQAAAGMSTSERNYTQTDANMTAPVYYYRVKLIDFDGRSTYTNIVTIKKAGNVKGVRLYPNPVVSNLNIEFTKAKGDYTISLFNLGGQEVLTQKTVIAYDVQTIPVSKGNLPPGSYYLRVRNNDGSEVYAEKVIIQ